MASRENVAPPAAPSDAEPGGLTSTQAEVRLAEHGPNVVPEAAAPSRWALLLRQLRAPMTALLAVAGALSLLVGNELDTVVIAAVVVLDVALGFTQEVRAQSAADALRSLVSPQATVIRDGTARSRPADGLVPGDLVVLAAGDRVPADGTIARTAMLELDESMLTGESLPIVRMEGDVAAGTIVTRGSAHVVVTATGADTRLGGIVTAAQRPRERTPLERQLAQLVGTLIRVGGALCVVLSIITWATGTGAAQSAMVGISLAVAAMPEGLPAVVAITLAFGVSRLAQHGAIIRRLAAVETLGSTTVLCADKTGTLTENRMTVTRACDADGLVCDLQDGVAVPPSISAVLSSAAVASEVPSAVQRARGVLEPTDAAVVAAAERFARPREEVLAGVRAAHVAPFDGAAQRVTATVEHDGGMVVVYAKGAPEPLLADGERALGAGDGQGGAALRAQLAAWAADGMRVLAVARDDGAGLRPIGLLGLQDPLRPGIADQVALARSAGVRTLMITGDHPATAAAVAAEAGIADGGRVVTGGELDAMPPAELATLLRGTAVCARAEPRHKLAIVDALRAGGDVVAMTGDGINDVPALRASDIGVAMGEGGTDAAREAADMVLVHNDYATIVRAIERGRVVYADIVRCVHFLLAANAGELTVFTLAIVLGLGAPLTVTQILLVNLLTDGLPAVALGADPAEPGVMRRPPRRPGESLLHGIGVRLLVAAALIGAASFASFAIGLHAGEKTGQTMALTTLVGTQLLYVFSVRGAGPAWRAGRNGWLVLSVIVSGAMMAAVLAVEPLADAFGTVPLSATNLLVAIGLGIMPPLVLEGVKAAVRRRGELSDRS